MRVLRVLPVLCFLELDHWSLDLFESIRDGVAAVEVV